MEPLPESFLATVLARIKVAPTDRVLVLRCGDGRACREIAAAANEGIVVGMDADGDAIREARKLSNDFENILYIQAEPAEIPWQDNFFTQVVMMDALDEVADPDAALRHVHRVMSPGGQLWIVNQASPANTQLDFARLIEAKLGSPQIEAITESAVNRMATVITANKPSAPNGI